MLAFSVRDMCMLDTVRARRDEIYALAKRHKALRLWVFGSCARKEESAESDIDFLVKFSPDVSFRDYDSLEQGFGNLFGRKVDIVSSRVLRNSPRFASRVCREAVPL